MVRNFLKLAVLTLSPGISFAEPATWVLDPAHVTVGFRVHHLGFANVIGLFREVEGSYVFDEASGELSSIDVRVSTASVFSNDEARDEHLRGRDFLSSNRFADMRFVFSSAQRIDERRFLVNGELELLGVTRPLQLEATVNKSGPYPIARNAYAMGVSAAGSLNRSDFGMDYAVDNGWVGDEVEIFIEFEARRQ